MNELFSVEKCWVTVVKIFEFLTDVYISVCACKFLYWILFVCIFIFSLIDLQSQVNNLKNWMNFLRNIRELIVLDLYNKVICQYQVIETLIKISCYLVILENLFPMVLSWFGNRKSETTLRSHLKSVTEWFQQRYGKQTHLSGRFTNSVTWSVNISGQAR